MKVETIKVYQEYDFSTVVQGEEIIRPIEKGVLDRKRTVYIRCQTSQFSFVLASSPVVSAPESSGSSMQMESMIG